MTWASSKEAMVFWSNVIAVYKAASEEGPKLRGLKQSALVFCNTGLIYQQKRIWWMMEIYLRLSLLLLFVIY